MMDLTTQLLDNYGKPTEDDLKRAESYLLSGQSKVYVSKDPKVFKLQVRCYAFTYVAERKNQGQREETPEEIERRTLDGIIDHDRKISRMMMGDTSKYGGISLWDPTIWYTQIVKILREDMPRTGKRNCILFGGTGSGKTFGAVAYVSQYADTYRTAHGLRINASFVTAYDLANYAASPGKHEAELRDIEMVKYLIVDDLAAEPGGYRGKDFVSYFENLVSKRFQYQRHMVVTSNTTIEQFIETYGPRVVSRFKEDGAVYGTNDPDYRAGKEPLSA